MNKAITKGMAKSIRIEKKAFFNLNFMKYVFWVIQYFLRPLNESL